ncbi:MAG: LemA family protein [Methanobacteriaceae archaeon]|nr:LemA family protein [Methanobacteriaceae archaeon]
MSLIFIILAIIIILIIIFAIWSYNNLVNYKNRVKNAWSQIDVQLKRRNDLIPNLLETVKGYAKHEKSTFEEVTKARTAVMNATSVDEVSKANNMLSSSLKSLFAVAENYPELKANENFVELQNTLEDTEDKISYARQFYNDTVLKFNNACEQFPSNIFAKIFGFKEAEFFEAATEEKAVPNIKF